MTVRQALFFGLCVCWPFEFWHFHVPTTVVLGIFVKFYTNMPSNGSRDCIALVCVAVLTNTRVRFISEFGLTSVINAGLRTVTKENYVHIWPGILRASLSLATCVHTPHIRKAASSVSAAHVPV